MRNPGCVNVICSDKTGTITKNEMTATILMTPEGYVADVTGTGYNDRGKVCIRKCDNAELARGSINNLLEVGCVCNNAVIMNDTLLGQPTEGALVAVAMKNGMYGVADKYLRLQEYPFSSEQKMMAVKCAEKYSDNRQEVFFAKGALEKILPQCTKYSANGQLYPLNQKKDQEFLAASHDIGQQGLRVLGLARGTSLQDLVYMGLVGICDPPREGVREAITTLANSGVKVKMVTGDAKETAGAIGEIFFFFFFFFFLFILSFSRNHNFFLSFSEYDRPGHDAHASNVRRRNRQNARGRIRTKDQRG